MRTAFASVDAAWLRMDEPANRMAVTGVLVLDRPVPLERVRRLVGDRLVRFQRFRERIVERPFGMGPPCWEEDPEFALDRHLFAVGPGPPDEAALQGLVSGLLCEPFPPGRPPWCLHYVERYEGGSALVVRIHHCVGDGLALVRVLLSMADGAPELPRAPSPGPDGPPRARGRGLLRVARASASAAPRALRLVRSLLADPGRAARAGATAAAHVRSLARLLLLSPEPATPLKGPLGLRKAVAWSRPFPLEDFKSVGRVTGSTVNDVLMAALAGGLRRYLLARGAVPPGLDVRGVVPVNLRAPGEPCELGNRFGLVFVPLPLGGDDPLARLFEVRRRMRIVKRTPEAAAVFELLWLMGMAPRPLFERVLDVFASRSTLVVTNVVGPRAPISMAGVPLRQAMFWVPSAGHLGLGVSLLSYAGSVLLGVQTDAGLVPDPGRIVAGFEEELRALLTLRRDVAV